MDNACTLGVFFKTETEPDKNFLPTAKRGVGDRNNSCLRLKDIGLLTLSPDSIELFSSNSRFLIFSTVR
ncbi:hypothetical protein Glove_139g290 [Diversispora epigaea]|uniref:Uncharacterized protein n=1 Tax=Diversispora epigaea TaxID=1348612 RepID=A0A397IZY5_9GLOM|nr:hypothetical protein Glove_139g290 [Diversispora epigaea]